MTELAKVGGEKRVMGICEGNGWARFYLSQKRVTINGIFFQKNHRELRKRGKSNQFLMWGVKGGETMRSRKARVLYEGKTQRGSKGERTQGG